MTTTVDTRLTILVPNGQEAPLRAALRGPGRWWGVDMQAPDATPNHTTSHAHIAFHTRTQQALQHEAASTQAAFRAAHEGYPDALPVGLEDARRWVLAGQPSPRARHTVGFSFPKLVGFGPDLFRACFPATPHPAGWWTPHQDDLEAYQAGDLGWPKLYQNLLGTPSLPTHIGSQHSVFKPAGLDEAVVTITWSTNDAPVTTLDLLLPPLLEQHGATALMVWMDEQYRSGFVHIDPHAPPLSMTFAPNAFVEAYENGEGTMVTEWDRMALIAAIAEHIPDARFPQLAILP